MHILKELRLLHHLTQAELADLLGVSEGIVRKLEKDSSTIKNSILKKYSKAFDVDIDEIFLGSKCEIFVFIENKRSKVFQNSQ